MTKNTTLVIPKANVEWWQVVIAKNADCDALCPEINVSTLSTYDHASTIYVAHSSRVREDAISTPGKIEICPCYGGVPVKECYL